ncbi:LAS seventeen-binding protein 1 [Leucoagaricus sp. SymC.cos]|nr:LAS seventeen-binding protein 1 [Leucoagaricus sp. SymC.cos]
MVFANLGTNEKDAFFSLLDEYFASRPEIINALKGASSSPAPGGGSNPFRKEITGPQAQAAAAAVGRAGDAAAKFVTTGFKNMQNASANARASHTPSASTVCLGFYRQSEQPSSNADTMDTESGGSVKDRIAALRAGGGNIGGAGAADRGSVSNLRPVKKFGEVDMSSSKNFIGSIRNSSSNPPKSSFQNTQSTNAADNIPSAFPPPNNGSRFGPPPTRTAASSAPPPPGQPEPEPEEEQGEWVEALYDFETSESGDLELKEGQRILLIERTSDDWWTGELNGKTGLFPASYVKLL